MYLSAYAMGYSVKHHIRGKTRTPAFSDWVKPVLRVLIAEETRWLELDMCEIFGQKVTQDPGRIRICSCSMPTFAGASSICTLIYAYKIPVKCGCFRACRSGSKIYPMFRDAELLQCLMASIWSTNLELVHRAKSKPSSFGVRKAAPCPFKQIGGI